MAHDTEELTERQEILLTPSMKRAALLAAQRVSPDGRPDRRALSPYVRGLVAKDLDDKFGAGWRDGTWDADES